MSAIDVITALHDLGATVHSEGAYISLRAPAGVTDQHRKLVLSHRAELLAYLAQQVAAELPPAPSAVNCEPVFIDLETRSACKLKQFGGRIYAKHPSTQVLSLVALIDNLAVVWFPTLAKPPAPELVRPETCAGDLVISTFAGSDLPAVIRDALAAGRPLCGHNVFDFDRPVWEAQDWPHPSSWIDTIHAARAACAPGKLDVLGERLLGQGKDAAGKQVLKTLMEPNRRAQFRPLTTDAAAVLGRYNLLDVIICREVHRRYYAHVELNVLALDQRINERGVRFDVELAGSLISIADELVRAAIADMEEATHGVIKEQDLRSDKVKNWLHGRGIKLPNLQRETIVKQLEGSDLPADVRAVLKARIIASRNSTTKLKTGLLHADSDGRLRHTLVYHKAHTGRWSGRGVQPQNLPRPLKELGDVTELIPAVANLAAFRAAIPAGLSVEDAISAMIRPCLCAAEGKVLATADFAAIEARGVAWCAGEAALLDQFAHGEDVYSQFASGLFGRQITKRDERERAVGKTAVLGCGYGMGAEKFGAKCHTDKVDLASVGLTAETVIETYRSAYPAIAGRKAVGKHGEYRVDGLWKDLERAAREAIETGQRQNAAFCIFEKAGGALAVQLPSGRQMFFRNARLEQLVPHYATRLGLPPMLKPTIVYTNTRNLDDVLYGGKLTENVVSGICRDLQVAAMLAMEKAGLPIVLHVHDEIVIEIAEAEAEAALNHMLEIMSSVPAWATGFPIEVEGFVLARYVKSAPAGAICRKARDGKLLTD